MHISSLLTLLSAPLLVFAAGNGPNAFKVPPGGYSATGGKALTLQWTPTTNGSVTLVLRSGSATDLDEGTIIASSIPNSGSYTWTPSNSITSGDDNAVEIIDDSDPTQVNYTPHFTLDTTTTETHTTGVVTFTTPDSSIVSHAPTKTKTTQPTLSPPSSSVTLSIHNTFTSRATSSTTGLTEITHSPSKMPTGAGSSPSMAASTPSAGAAARATAMALGMVGVALGALAL